MRLAVISTMEGGCWGGSEELWAAAAHEALQNGHSVFASTKRWPVTPAEILELQRAGASISRRKVYPEPTRRQWLANRLFRRNRWWHWKELQQFDADIICISQGTTYDCCDEYFGRLFDLCLNGSTPYVILCQWNDESYSPRGSVRRRAAQLLSKASLVAMVSARHIPLTERQIGRKLPNAMIVRNPVNLEAPERAEPWPADAPVRLAVVGRLDVRKKGQDLLMAALSSPKWLARSWELALFGDGPDRDYLIRLARFCGIEGRVRLAGHVDDVRSIWREHQLLVLPSRSEGTPLAMVEAMLCGRPCVVTDVGGTTEWIDDGVNGFVAEAPSERYINRALEKAWTAQSRWEAMGRAARQRALALYDPKAGRTLLDILCRCATECS